MFAPNKLCKHKNEMAKIVHSKLGYIFFSDERSTHCVVSINVYINFIRNRVMLSSAVRHCCILLCTINNYNGNV